MAQPLKASPLAIEHHALVALEVTASEADNPGGNHSLRTHRKIERHPDDEHRWMVDLTVEIGTADGGEEAPYSGKITVRGWFVIAEAYPEDQRRRLIEVTAASILYGTCREALANFTARSIHGMLSIPSVAFEPITKAGKTAKKTAAKRAKTAGEA